MKMYFTKTSLKNLSVEILPVIDVNGQRIGEEANPGHKQYSIFDLDRNSPPGFGLYVGKTKSSFFLQVRVGHRVKKVVVGELGALILSSPDPKLDARTKANELRARLKAGENVAQAKREESKVSETTLQDLLTNYLAAYKLKPTVKENTLHAIESAIKRLKPWGDTLVATLMMVRSILRHLNHMDRGATQIKMDIALCTKAAFRMANIMEASRLRLPTAISFSDYSRTAHHPAMDVGTMPMGMCMRVSL